VLLDELDVRM